MNITVFELAFRKPQSPPQTGKNLKQVQISSSGKHKIGLPLKFDLKSILPKFQGILSLRSPCNLIRSLASQRIFDTNLNLAFRSVLAILICDVFLILPSQQTLISNVRKNQDHCPETENFLKEMYVRNAISQNQGSQNR